MKNHPFAIAWRGQKTLEFPVASQRLACEPLCERAERHRLDGYLDFTSDAGFLLLRLVFESQIKSGQSSGRVPKRLNFSDTGCQGDLVFHSSWLSDERSG